jgi:hypothetical protein
MGNAGSSEAAQLKKLEKYKYIAPESASTPLLAAAPPKVTKIRTLRDIVGESGHHPNGKYTAGISIPKGTVLPVTGSFTREESGPAHNSPGLLVSYTDPIGQTFTNISVYDREFIEDYPSYEKITNGGRRRKNSKRRKNLRTRRSRK